MKDRPAFGYSGMWWLKREEFLQVPLDPIENLEGATFSAFDNLGYEKVLMTRDWLDFSVEHLSRYFKMIDYKDTVSFHRMVEILKRYIHETRFRFDNVDRSASAHTIAIIPMFVAANEILSEHTLARLNKADKPQLKALLDLYSLTAALLSLWQLGIPRVVVAGNEKEIPLQVEVAFALVTSMVENYKGRQLSLTFTKTKAHFRSKDQVLIPKSAICDLQQAMLGNVSLSQAYLGDDPTFWKYVYFTEPDLILHTRASALDAITQRLQEGFIVSAHRFQPMPHVVDFPNHTWQGELLPMHGNLSVFYDLDPETDSCCYIGDDQPGRFDYPRTCGPWYHCGLSKSFDSDENASFRFQRLEQYPLVRLTRGLQVPLVNEHARKCLPSKRGTCSRDIP